MSQRTSTPLRELTSKDDEDLNRNARAGRFSMSEGRCCVFLAQRRAEEQGDGVLFASGEATSETSMASADENRFLNENLRGVGARLFSEQGVSGRYFRSANERKDEA